MNSRKKLIIETLEKINITNNLRGYPILIEIITSICNSNQTELKQLIETIALKYNTTAISIDNTLRNIITLSSLEIIDGTISNEVTQFIGNSQKNFKTKKILFIIKDFVIQEEQTRNLKNLSNEEKRRLLITKTLAKLNIFSSHKGYYIFISIIELLFKENQNMELETIKQIIAINYNTIPENINNHLKAIISTAKESIQNGTAPEDIYLYIDTFNKKFIPINFLYLFKEYIKYLEEQSKKAIFSKIQEEFFQTPTPPSPENNSNNQTIDFKKEVFIPSLINSLSINDINNQKINEIIEEAKKLNTEITPREIITLVSTPKKLIKELAKTNK